MRQQIRRGTFETNSSSTHSMQLMPSDFAKTMQTIREEIVKTYSDKDCLHSIFSEEEYFKDGEILLKELDIEGNEETHSVYAIIENPIAKVERLFSYIVYWAWKLPSVYDKDGTWRYVSTYTICERFLQTEQYQWFVECVISAFEKYYPQKGVKGLTVPLDSSYRTYFAGSCGENPIIVEEDVFNESEFKKKIEQVLSPSVFLIDKDIPYSPYLLPTIQIF